MNEAKLKRIRSYFVETVKYCLAKTYACLFYRHRHIWLFSERGTDARDNGLYMYRYVRTHHPEIEAYYVISKDSKDRNKLASLGNLVDTQSFRHYILFFAAEYRISSHNRGAYPANDYYSFLKRKLGREPIENRSVFLQHGIIKDDMPGLYKKNAYLRLFICGAKPEYDYILSRYGYSEKELKYTGLARFDGLHDFQIKRQVLVMPTWRDWLSPNFHGKKIDSKVVIDSSFFHHWNSLLTSPRLGELAQKYDVSFVFYPHYEMQPFLNLYEAGNASIVLADFEHYDVQQLLKESMLLITDYSSVFFDFAYMNKPVLYYQFDEAEYRANHYAEGYFDYRRDGFGEVVTEEGRLLAILEQYLEMGCQLKPEYAQRIEGFFPLHDANNCERIYNEIIKLKVNPL